MVLADAAAVVSDADRQKIVEALRRRGPDARRTHSGAGAFLVYTHLDTGRPETCSFATLGSYLSFLGDLRLDNGDELRETLGLDRRTAATDAEIVIAAYRRWGVECCEHFIGDFAFAIWDEAQRLLYCARDHFGVRPLYYRHGPASFSFSSDAKALGATPTPPMTERDIASFLSGYFEAPDETVHPGIFRLHPAHRLTWQDGKLTTSRYWELTPEDPAGKDPEEEFRFRFVRAVKARMGDTDKLGVMLSGGLDSSSIASVVSDELKAGSGASVNTFSHVFDKLKELDERRYMDAVLAKGHLIANRIVEDDVSPFDDIEEMFLEQDGLFPGPNHAMARRIYPFAASKGTKVLLDGHGGDEVVWHGGERLFELASRGEWLTLAGLMNTVCRTSRRNPLLLYLRLVGTNKRNPLLTRIAQAAYRRLQWMEKSGPQEEPWTRLLTPDFIERTGLAERAKERNSKARVHRGDDQFFQHEALTAPLQHLAMESLDRMSSWAGLEARYPFYDIRLVRFSLGLPSSERLRRNGTRSILRRALKGVLPDIVRTRQEKTDFSPLVARGILKEIPFLTEHFSRIQRGTLYKYIDTDALSKALRRFCSSRGKEESESLRIILTSFRLLFWLQSHEASLQSPHAG